MPKAGYASVTLSDHAVDLALRLEPHLLIKPQDGRRRGSLATTIEAALEELTKRLAADPKAIPLELFGEEGTP